MIYPTLTRTGWRYLLRHPWQSLLMVIGISLGVAVVVAVDLANASASRAFDLSTTSITGKTTHQIGLSSGGLDENLYIHLRKLGLQIAMAPVITEYISSPEMGSRPLQLLGIDPFADAPFRDYLGTSASDDLTPFLTRRGSVLISEDLADAYNLELGQTISMEVAGQVKEAWIAGLLNPADNLSRRALDGLILADIATVQELTGRLGQLDYIDLILPEGQPALIEHIHSALPDGLRITPAASRSGSVEQMTAAFQVNLTALSMLALVVGMFLIYNTITFSVVQRRPLFGILRSLGVTQGEIFALVILEAALVGILGAVLGAGLGIFMGQGAVRLVTQTINDLFFVVSVHGIQVPLNSLFKGAILGVCATLVTAAPPAWEAASVTPRAALSRSSLERKTQRAIHLATSIGLGIVCLGLIILFIPSRSLTLGFAGAFMVVVGFALLVPQTTSLLMKRGVNPFGRIWGTLGRMAPRNVAASLSRTSIAVMALMVAISVTIGVSLMVTSFRATVITWLNETLKGDIYISAPSLTATTPSAPLDPHALTLLAEYPGVERVDILRSVDIDSPEGPVHIAASDNADVGYERIFLSTDIPIEEIWDKMQNGAVLVSEPFANRLGLPRHGGSVQLYTNAGARSFPVVGIYYDYASTQGAVLMALPVYQELWHDKTINAAALRLAPRVDADELSNQLQEVLAPIQRLLVRPNKTLRQDVLVVFDRTFAITGALQTLATVVAFIGVMSALLSLELERGRELGILRSIGLTVRQVWGLIALETGLMGAIAGLLAMPTGYALALILVFIINRRSFGWTLRMQIDWLPFVQALVLAISAALLAGIYPALRIGRMVISDALRSE